MATTEIRYACMHQAISAVTGIVAVPRPSKFFIKGDFLLADLDEFELVPTNTQPEYPDRTSWTAEGSTKIFARIDPGVVDGLMEIWPALKKDKPPWIKVGVDVLYVRAHPSCPEVARKIIDQYCNVERRRSPGVREHLVELWNRVESLASVSAR